MPATARLAASVARLVVGVVAAATASAGAPPAAGAQADTAARLLPPLGLGAPGLAGPPLPPPPLPPRPAPEDLRGLSVRIEDPTGAMDHVNARLAAAARGDLRAVVRLAVYSDSVNGADWVTGALREGLQARFGDGGKGFVPIAPGWPSQAHRGLRWAAEGWDVDVVNRAARRDGRYGLGGVVATARGRGARARFALDGRHHRAALLLERGPDGGSVRLDAGGDAARLETAAPAPEDALVETDLAPLDALQVAGGGGVARLYGAVFERGGPGVVVDALMLIGAFARTLLHLEPAHWAAQVRLRAPDLLVFWMGGNDAVQDAVGFSPARFVEGYAEAIRRARAGRPEASCLVVSVLDSGERVDGRARTQPRVPRVVDAQREVALQTGCAFFDLFRAIGGEHTVAAWVRADPPLVSGDLKHLTTAGARHVGRLLERALLRSYDAWLAREAAAAR